MNNLQLFWVAYIGVTNRLDFLTDPGGQIAHYSYFDNLEDRRLQQIKNQTSGMALFSQFDYTYDDEGQIKTWTKNNPGLSAPQRYDLTYDNADQLTQAPLKNATTNTVITNYLYAYDLASNRRREKIGTVTTDSTLNSVNEIVSQSGGTNRTLTYDLNGNLTNDGLTRTFEWDAANRLIAINYTGGNRSEFTYDGLSRCVKIVEKTNGSVTSTRKFVWCGMEKCEFRNAGDVVTDFIYPQGQQTAGVKYFYARDHLGSIREMFRLNGTVVARFDYDPWGRSTAVINTTLPDFNFTGLYRHSASNLDFAAYRAYDPDLGRWLSRDPIGEEGGVNLYAYVSDNPMNLIDPFGLREWFATSFAAAQAGAKADWAKASGGNVEWGGFVCKRPCKTDGEPFYYTGPSMGRGAGGKQSTGASSAETYSIPGKDYEKCDDGDDRVALHWATPHGAVMDQRDKEQMSWTGPLMLAARQGGQSIPYHLIPYPTDPSKWPR